MNIIHRNKKKKRNFFLFERQGSEGKEESFFR
jgi:hypothetical protein